MKKFLISILLSLCMICISCGRDDEPNIPTQNNKYLNEQYCAINLANYLISSGVLCNMNMNSGNIIYDYEQGPKTLFGIHDVCFLTRGFNIYNQLYGLSYNSSSYQMIINDVINTNNQIYKWKIKGTNSAGHSFYYLDDNNIIEIKQKLEKLYNIKFDEIITRGLNYEYFINNNVYEDTYENYIFKTQCKDNSYIRFNITQAYFAAYNCKNYYIGSMYNNILDCILAECPKSHNHHE